MFFGEVVISIVPLRGTQLHVYVLLLHVPVCIWDQRQKLVTATLLQYETVQIMLS